MKTFYAPKLSSSTHGFLVPVAELYAPAPTTTDHTNVPDHFSQDQHIHPTIIQRALGNHHVVRRLLASSGDVPASGGISPRPVTTTASLLDIKEELKSLVLFLKRILTATRGNVYIKSASSNQVSVAEYATAAIEAAHAHTETDPLQAWLEICIAHVFCTIICPKYSASIPDTSKKTEKLTAERQPENPHEIDHSTWVELATRLVAEMACAADMLEKLFDRKPLDEWDSYKTISKKPKTHAPHLRIVIDELYKLKKTLSSQRPRSTAVEKHLVRLALTIEPLSVDGFTAIRDSFFGHWLGPYMRNFSADLTSIADSMKQQGLYRETRHDQSFEKIQQDITKAKIGLAVRKLSALQRLADDNLCLELASKIGRLIDRLRSISA